MRRTRIAQNSFRVGTRAYGALVALFLFAFCAAAQVEGPLHPQSSAQSLPDEYAPTILVETDSPALPDMVRTTIMNAGWPLSQPSLPPLPERVAIPADQRIAVVLDSPLSTRISKQGQVVTFRTSAFVQLTDELEIPPDVEILGRVIEVKRPGHFAKAGVIRVKVESIRLDPASVANLEAHLDSAEMKGQGRLTTDNRNATNLSTVVLDSLSGTLLGAVIGGAKGAGIGAGAGAAVAVLIMMSHRGQDVYLEPGMPFSVILDQPAYLSGTAIYASEQNYQKTKPGPRAVSTDDQNNGEPKLKRRGQQPRK
jgi:hypothetical protein